MARHEYPTICTTHGSIADGCPVRECEGHDHEIPARTTCDPRCPDYEETP